MSCCSLVVVLLNLNERTNKISKLEDFLSNQSRHCEGLPEWVMLNSGRDHDQMKMLAEQCPLSESN